MLVRRNEYSAEIRTSMRGGQGGVEIINLINPEYSNEKCRLFAKITMKQGTSIGLHKHLGEVETYYILSGQATAGSGNQEDIALYPGDGMYTGFGDSHTIRNDEPDDLVFIALILLD